MTVLPLTQAQHGIWVGQQMAPDSPAYWTAEALSLQGPLDAAAWRQALDHVVRHAQSLHMTVDKQGQARYPSTPLAAVPACLALDVSGQADPWAAAQQAMARLHPPAPDMQQGPLFVQAWIRLAPDHHIWVMWAHHLVLDGWGHMLLARAVVQTYEQLTQGHAAPSLTPWDMAPIVSEDLAQQAPERQGPHAAFWQAQLQGAQAVSLAPPWPLAPTVLRRQVQVDADRFASWRDAATRHQQEWSAWLLAGVAAWLWQQTGAPDLTLGLPVMNRLGSAALSVPCMAMNIVPLRIQVQAGDTPQALAQHIAQRLRTLRPHQRYRYEAMRRDAGRMGGTRRLFGPVVNIMPFDRPTALPGLSIQTQTLASGPVEDWALNLIPLPSDGGLLVKLEAHPQAYNAATLDTHLHALQAVWTRLAQAPQTPLAQLLPPQVPTAPPSCLTGPAWPPLVHTEPYASPVLNAVRAHAHRREPGQGPGPEQGTHPAVEHDNCAMSYAQLWAQAQATAAKLRPHLTARTPKVLVMLPRQPDTVCILLAVWLAGGCYIPLDPQTSPTRLAAILADAQPDLVLTTADWLPHIPCGIPVLTSACPPSPACASADGAVSADHLPAEAWGPPSADACAYVIYTSGSTGRPNGVMVSHRALGHFLSGARQVYGLTPSDRMLQFAPLHFDASVEELYLPLLTGATVVLRQEEMLSSARAFLSHCQQWGITVLDLPTAYWHELAFALDGDAAARTAWPDSTRLVIIGGEAALTERLQRWQRHIPTHVTLLNTYGPTEATVICATAVLAGPQAQALDEGLPIGTPLPGTQLWVVDEQGRPVPMGQTGQLCILGPALALGYLNREEATAQRFAPLASHPDSQRAYRTGDLVRINAHGQLVFQGRIDDEIKISGHRIDPSEVEAALLSHPDVQEAAVLGQTLPNGDKRLLAFVVSGQAHPDAVWRQHLMPQLPAAAWPALYVALPKLPRNANNKVDRKALLAHRLDVQPARHSPALTPLEQAIANVWQPLLGDLDLSPESDFFALGGRSLQAIQAATRLGVALQRDVPVSWLFAHPTLAELAQALSAPVAHHPPPLAAGGELAPLLPIQNGSGPALFCVHPAEGLSWCYFGLCRHLPGIPIWGLQSRGMTDAPPLTFESMVDDYLALIRQAQAQGPYRLLGWSSGGGIAHALACRLQAAGDTVSLLAFMDSYPADIWAGTPEPTEGDALEALLDVIGANAWAAPGQRLPVPAMKALLRQAGGTLSALDESVRDRMVDSAVHGMRLYRSARHAVFQGPLLYCRAAIRPSHAPAPQSWHPYVSGPLNLVDVDSNHNNMSQPAPLATVGRALASHLKDTA